jgi:hypothetical protein
MKSQFFLLLVGALALQGSVQAQDKPKSTPSSAPKVLVFPPGSKQPQVMAEASEKPLAGPAGVPDGIAQMVAIFFGSLQRVEVDQAYSVLTKGSKIADKPEELKQLKSKTQEAIEVFGSILGYDLVEARSVGNRLVRATYASHGKVYPLRWRFYFYKPDETWRLIDMRVDDKLSGMFDEPEDSKNPKAELP